MRAYTICYSANTLDCYIGCITRFFEYLPSDISLVDINIKILEEFIIFLDNKGYKNTTIRLYLDALESFFTYCCEEGYMVKNPAKIMDRPKIEREIPYILSEDSIFKLREATKHNARDRAILEVFLATGIRVSELCSLPKNHILDKKNHMYIEGKGEKDRLVIFNDVCRERLDLYFKTRNDSNPLAFLSCRHRGFATGSINSIFTNYSKLIGFPINVSPHMFRRTFATKLYQNRMELRYIKRLMGHETILTTLLYTQISNVKYL